MILESAVDASAQPGDGQDNAWPECAGSSADVIDYLLELSQLAAEASSPAARAEINAKALALACRAIPDARWASITQLGGRQARTTASSDQRADTLDSLQYLVNQGPSLTALAEQASTVTHFAHETRWPEFIIRIRQNGIVQSALSLPLASAGHPRTSLNLYSDLDTAFDPASIPLASLVAAGIGLALTASSQRNRADNLEIALRTNRQVGAAIGILMHRHHLNSEQAFDALRAFSQRSHRKLRDIADMVTLTGELPTPTP